MATSIEGVDYSWARPGGALLASAGKKFAGRYLLPDGGGGKGLDKSELDDLTANGVDVFNYFERYAERTKEGYAAGAEDGRVAQAELVALGLPSDMPVYFAVDYDAPESDQPSIDDYLRGAASVVGASRTGVYGGYWIVKRCKENGTATWFCQTYAWSGGNVLDGIHLYQYQNDIELEGHAVDLVRALQENYGQASKFGGNTPQPPTPPTPPQGGGDLTQYTVQEGDMLSTIAPRFDTTTEYLVQINNIADPDKIYAGDVINVPNKQPSSGRQYTIVEGDTLSGIADKFDTTTEALAVKNGITNIDEIYAGDVINI